MRFQIFTICSDSLPDLPLEIEENFLHPNQIKCILYYSDVRAMFFEPMHTQLSLKEEEVRLQRKIRLQIAIRLRIAIEAKFLKEVCYVKAVPLQARKKPRLQIATGLLLWICAGVSLHRQERNFACK